jgi:hypothetical protein
MESQPNLNVERKPTSHIMKGLIISLILIVISIVGNFLGPKQAQTAGYCSYAILFIGIIWACINYGKQMNARVTFGNVFGHGFKTSAVITVIVVIFSVIFFLIFPDIKDKALDMAREEMEKGGKMTDEQISTAMNFVQKSFMIFVVGGTVFFYLFIGVIASLIGAGVTKKEPPTPFERQA